MFIFALLSVAHNRSQKGFKYTMYKETVGSKTLTDEEDIKEIIELDELNERMKPLLEAIQKQRASSYESCRPLQSR